MDEEKQTESQSRNKKQAATSQIDFAAMSIPEIDVIIETAQKAREEKKAAEIARLKAEFEGQLSQLHLSLGDVFPQPVSTSTRGRPKGKATSEKADLEATEKGATYQNPANPAETWTAGVKKGRAPAWVTELREKGELHKHKVAS